ncbi:hypothetical protein ACFFJT_18275 [Dyella flava]|uniref:Peptidase MA superfamily protein n=1 Tax=Dyella flava TaxID=1920170 RepID=A0ABS2JZM5_9GAMM|nr:hypothetical protein [Dyella flava]MBM7124451.1 hypothetical protein [Dyella flava]GLQ51888.1 hypothetical protein GCM10010872_33370 [Dyella flava]
MKRRRFLQWAGGLTIAASSPLRAIAPSDDDPEDIFNRLKQSTELRFAVAGGNISVAIAGNASPLDKLRIEAWVRRGASAISAYFGRFSVENWGLLVTLNDGDHIGPATTWGHPSSITHINLGRNVSDSALRDDWVMVHEMTHLALPRVPQRSAWFMEGNATYVEPIARAQRGQLTPQEVWRWAVDDMPKGQPRDGDEGLDHTHTWGRTYWGGAMYWLLAEIAIYKSSGGRYRLQDALRAINRKSGGNTSFWSVEQTTFVGDAAVHGNALESLYRAQKDRPVTVDLTDVLQQLGISEVDGAIRFDDRAPLAGLRRSVTTLRAPT